MNDGSGSRAATAGGSTTGGICSDTGPVRRIVGGGFELASAARNAGDGAAATGGIAPVAGDRGGKVARSWNAGRDSAARSTAAAVMAAMFATRCSASGLAKGATRAANVSALGRRRVASFSSAWAMVATIASGASGRCVRSATGCLSTMAIRSWPIPSAMNTRSPVSISWNRIPSAQMSARSSTCMCGSTLLGRHVARRAEQAVHLGELVLAVLLLEERLGDPEVDDRHAQISAGAHRDEDVRRLEIAVHDPVRVRDGERLADLQHQIACLLERQPAADLLEQVREIRPLEALHDDERAAHVGADVEHPGHVLRGDEAHQTRLAPEASHRLDVLDAGVLEHLDHHHAFELQVEGAVEDGHLREREPLLDPTEPADDVPLDERGRLLGVVRR